MRFAQCVRAYRCIKTITHADVYAIDGLESGENDVYTAYLGEEFTLGVKWYNARVTSPDIEWRMSADEGEEAVVATGQKTLSLTYERANLGKTYTIYAVVNEIKSSSIKVTPAEAPLSQPTITCSTHSIVDGKIQQNRLQKLSNVLLSVSWNEEDISQALGIQVKWYVDGVLLAENVRDFSYNAETLVTKDCNVVISVVIGYQNGEDTIAKDASVTLVFVSEYDLVSSVKVFPSEEGGKLKRVAPDTYYLTGESDADNTAEFTTSLSPDSAYQKQNASGRCVAVTTLKLSKRRTERRIFNLPMAKHCYGKYRQRAKQTNHRIRNVLRVRRDSDRHQERDDGQIRMERQFIRQIYLLAIRFECVRGKCGRDAQNRYRLSNVRRSCGLAQQ